MQVEEILKMLDEVLVERVTANSGIDSLDYEVTIDTRMSPFVYERFIDGMRKEEEMKKQENENQDIGMEDPYESWGPFGNQEYHIKVDLQPAVDHILRSGNRTIVFWQDGTKTVVKRSAVDCPDDYMAFTAALAIKIFGSNSALKKMLKDKTYVQVKKVNGKHSIIKKSDLYAPLDLYEPSEDES